MHYSEIIDLTLQGKVNPFEPGLYNLTAQGWFIRNYPWKARKLMLEAGSTVEEANRVCGTPSRLSALKLKLWMRAFTSLLPRVKLIRSCRTEWNGDGEPTAGYITYGIEITMSASSDRLRNAEAIAGY